MNTSDFDYFLPPELIAQEPLKNRSDSRLLAVAEGGISHARFTDIKSHLKKGDCLVLNDTKVMPARLYGVKEGSGAPIEFLLLRRLDANTWEVILKPGRRAKPGAVFLFGDCLKAEILEVTEHGGRIVGFFYDGIFEEILDSLGEMPLPPYITKKLEDKQRYQTVYAKETGSAAAPTAGLHFTGELLGELKDMGVSIAYITLHVGLGTFRPVKAEKIENHVMHSEHYSVSAEAAEAVNSAKRAGGRIVAVGTTSVRTLESIADENGFIKSCFGETDIFIYPGYKFKTVDALITNFHLPQSTLLMLVSAFAGKQAVMGAYAEAIERKYRFFSFGDAMYLEKSEGTSDV